MKFDAVWKFAFPFSTFPRQEQAQFILSGTSLRRSGTKTFLFCFFPYREGAKAMHSGLQGKSYLCVQRADWTSDHSHSH